MSILNLATKRCLDCARDLMTASVSCDLNSGSHEIFMLDIAESSCADPVLDHVIPVLDHVIPVLDHVMDHVM